MTFLILQHMRRLVANICFHARRYAPKFEAPMFHFHRLLHADLIPSQHAEPSTLQQPTQDPAPAQQPSSVDPGPASVRPPPAEAAPDQPQAAPERQPGLQDPAPLARERPDGAGSAAQWRWSPSVVMSGIIAPLDASDEQLLDLTEQAVTGLLCRELPGGVGAVHTLSVRRLLPQPASGQLGVFSVRVILRVREDLVGLREAARSSESWKRHSHAQRQAGLPVLSLSYAVPPPAGRAGSAPLHSPAGRQRVPAAL